MADSKQLAQYVTEQLAPLSGIRSIPMMGGYVFYYRDRIFGGIYEPGFMVKPTAAAKAAMPDAIPTVPYPETKSLLLPVTILEDSEALCRMVEAMFDELPPPKAKKRR